MITPSFNGGYVSHASRSPLGENTPFVAFPYVVAKKLYDLPFRFFKRVAVLIVLSPSGHFFDR